MLSKSADMESQIEDTKKQIDEAKRQETEALQADLLTRTIKELKAAEAELETLERKTKAVQDKIEKSVQFVFLGLETQSDSFTLVVDMSGSMKSYKGLAFDTIDRIINSLKKHQKLSVIGFHIPGEKPILHYWPSKGKSASANLANKQNASKFIRKLSHEFKGATPTYSALQAALEMDNDAIVLLTDGMPTYPKGLTPSQIQQLITTANAGNKEIHTIGLGEYNAKPFFLDFLEGLAKSNNGHFTALSR